MTERVEQWYCIKFCQKHGDSKAETIQKIQQAFGNDAVGATEIKECFLTTSKMTAHWHTVTNVLGGHQQAEMHISLRMCSL
jgi:hypothetical protein